MKSVLITGCNRGIGLGLIKNLVKLPNSPGKIIATCRNVEEATELREIADCHKNVHILQIDLKDFDKYAEFSQEVGNIVQDEGLNVLFNNAAASPKFTRLNLLKVEQLLDTYKTNTMAPIMLTKALLKLLKKAAARNTAECLGIKRAAIINMTSILGSIELNTTGGMYPYRCSKSALNIATKSMSIELLPDGIIVAGIHPGWVKTDLGGNKAPLEIEDSVSGIINLLHDLNEKHNGGFYQWDGNPMPW